MRRVSGELVSRGFREEVAYLKCEEYAMTLSSQPISEANRDRVRGILKETGRTEQAELFAIKSNAFQAEAVASLVESLGDAITHIEYLKSKPTELEEHYQGVLDNALRNEIPFAWSNVNLLWEHLNQPSLKERSNLLQKVLPDVGLELSDYRATERILESINSMDSASL